MAASKIQEKFGFQVTSGERQGTFGPFDTREAAGKTAQALAATGVTVGDVEIVWTVSTARAMVAAANAKPAPEVVKPAPKARRARKS